MYSFILYKFKEDSNTILFREKYFTIKNNITKKRLIKFIINVIRRSDEIINVRVFLANVWKNNLYKFYTR